MSKRVVYFSTSYFCGVQKTGKPAVVADFFSIKPSRLEGGVDFYTGDNARVATSRKSIWWYLPVTVGIVPLRFTKKHD